MVLAGASNAITDASGNKWTITGTGQVAVNGVADTTTAGVTELAYVNDGLAGERQPTCGGARPARPRHGRPGGHEHQSAAGADHHCLCHHQLHSQPESGLARGDDAGTTCCSSSGSGDIVSLSGGANTITDTGTGNTYILPAAGKGTDTFTSNILTTKDTLDLKTALAATNWTGSASTLAKYLTVTDSAQGATLSIAATSGGAGVAIAKIDGANTATLTSLLAHAIT